MENLTKFEQFKNKKNGTKLNEGVVKIGNSYVVSDIEVPASLVNSYIKKVKDETGKNLREMFSDQDVVFRIIKYCVDNYLQIDNLPASIVTGEDVAEEVEVQDTQAQEPIQSQDSQAEPVQTDAQGQAQGQAQPQAAQGQAAQGQAAQTAQEIPATETGTQTQEI